MTLLTGLIGYGWMNIGIENSPSIRPMGIMAGRTAGIGHRIVHMLLNKGRPIRLVTTDAEDHKVFLQEMIRLSRTVRIVAIEAVFLHRRVFEFHLS
jgi:hypothetical protein